MMRLGRWAASREGSGLGAVTLMRGGRRDVVALPGGGTTRTGGCRGLTEAGGTGGCVGAAAPAAAAPAAPAAPAGADVCPAGEMETTPPPGDGEPGTSAAGEAGIRGGTRRTET